MSKKRRNKSIRHPSEKDPQKNLNRRRWFPPYLIIFATMSISFSLNYQKINSWIKAARLDDTKMTREEMLDRASKSHLVELVGRKLLATNHIPAETILIEIPREMMIWDLDAVRHPFIREELFQARLVGIDTTTRRAALLSAYIALLRNGVISPVYNTHVSVVKTMPSYEEYASFHPVLIESSKLEQCLGGTYSPGYQQVISTREQIVSEYNEFASVSTKFASQVSKEAYVSFRIAVQSRSFHVSEVTESEALKTGPDLQSEKEYFRQTIQVDFDDFAVSIMPVNDWMNAHTNNNVQVKEYDPVSRTCQASTIKSIPKGGELVNNYGDMLDIGRFSQYGYVPSDGTGLTFARLYAYHDISWAGFQLNIEPSQEQMLPYLQRDFGYFECVEKEKHPEASELKRLKVMYLQKIATDTNRWHVPLPRREKLNKSPLSTTALPDNYKIPGFDDEIYDSDFLSSATLGASLPCRLITLTHRDLNGHGVTLLKEDLKKIDEESSDVLLKLEEVHINIAWMTRTLRCMHTLASVQKQKYGRAVSDQANKIMEMSQNSNVSSFEWNAAHIMLGEMQSQEVIENFTLNFLESIEIDGSSEDFFFRNELCPWKYSIELLL